jgi:hypothetical protein
MVTAKLVPMKDPPKGLRVQCCECSMLVSADRVMLDPEEAGSFYCWPCITQIQSRVVQAAIKRSQKTL